MDNVKQITIHYRLVYIITKSNGNEEAIHQGGTLEASPDSIPSPKLILEHDETLTPKDREPGTKSVYDTHLTIELIKR